MMSQKDVVTNLFNRQYFIDALTTTVQAAKTGKTTAAVMLMHLDNFSSIKQSTGVVGSDQYLKELAAKLAEASSTVAL
jgi:multidomain signaling protein FimX